MTDKVTRQCHQTHNLFESRLLPVLRYLKCTWQSHVTPPRHRLRSVAHWRRGSPPESKVFEATNPATRHSLSQRLFSPRGVTQNVIWDGDWRRWGKKWNLEWILSRRNKCHLTKKTHTHQTPPPHKKQTLQQQQQKRKIVGGTFATSKCSYFRRSSGMFL